MLCLTSSDGCWISMQLRHGAACFDVGSETLGEKLSYTLSYRYTLYSLHTPGCRTWGSRNWWVRAPWLWGSRAPGLQGLNSTEKVGWGGSWCAAKFLAKKCHTLVNFLMNPPIKWGMSPLGNKKLSESYLLEGSSLVQISAVSRGRRCWGCWSGTCR